MAVTTTRKSSARCFRFKVAVNGLAASNCIYLLTSLVICFGFSTANGEEQFVRIKTPSPASMEGHLEDAGLVLKWISASEVITSTHIFECAAVYESSITSFGLNSDAIVTSQRLNATVGSFRLAEDMGASVRRLIATRQPAFVDGMTDDAKAKLVSMTDYFEAKNKALVRKASGLVSYENVVEGEASELVGVTKNTGAFHPVRACVTPLVQTLSGGSLNVHGHSVLPSTIKGVVKDAKHTFALLVVQDVQLVLVFADECPVQVEVSRTGRGNVGTPEITDLIQSRWSEVADGIFLPVRIRGMHRSLVRSAELDAKISWRLNNHVDQKLFEKATVGELFSVLQSPADGL